jgi:hypothetical protein
MEHLESIKTFLNKIDSKIDSLEKRLRSKAEKLNEYLRSNFKNVREIKVEPYQRSEGVRGEWRFEVPRPQMIGNPKFSEAPENIHSIKIQIDNRFSPKSITINISSFGVVISEWRMDFKDINNIKSEIENKINGIEQRRYQHNKEHQERIEHYTKLRKDLSDELPMEDLEEILSDIKDLSIVEFSIKMQVTSENPKPFYDVRFQFKNLDDEEDKTHEYSEFYRILSESIRRIRNTYNVEVKWSQKMSRVIINLP